MAGDSKQNVDDRPVDGLESLPPFISSPFNDQKESSKPVAPPPPGPTPPPSQSSPPQPNLKSTSRSSTTWVPSVLMTANGAGKTGTPSQSSITSGTTTQPSPTATIIPPGAPPAGSSTHGPASSSATPVPAAPSHGLTHPQLVAAIVAPIVVVFAPLLAVFIFCCCRRRRRRQSQRSSSSHERQSRTEIRQQPPRGSGPRLSTPQWTPRNALAGEYERPLSYPVSPRSRELPPIITKGEDRITLTPIDLDRDLPPVVPGEGDSPTLPPSMDERQNIPGRSPPTQPASNTSSTPRLNQNSSGPLPLPPPKRLSNGTRSTIYLQEYPPNWPLSPGRISQTSLGANYGYIMDRLSRNRDDEEASVVSSGLEFGTAGIRRSEVSAIDRNSSGPSGLRHSEVSALDQPTPTATGAGSEVRNSEVSAFDQHPRNSGLRHSEVSALDYSGGAGTMFRRSAADTVSIVSELSESDHPDQGHGDSRPPTAPRDAI